MKKAVLQSLKKVIDPETGLDIVSMGMVDSVVVKSDIVRIKFIPTSPFCPMVGYLTDKIKEAAKSVKGVKKVEVEVGH
jgi:metal-sulfur cluster biosynthetic enzyme